MPTSFPYIGLRLFTFLLLLLQPLQNTKNITLLSLLFCYCYHHYHITLLLNTLLQILSYLGVVELTTQLLILENILWLPLCRINKFGLNTLASKTVVIPYTCGLSADSHDNCITIINWADDLKDYTGPQERSHSSMSAYVMHRVIWWHATLSSCSPIRLRVRSKLMLKPEFLNGCGVHIGAAISTICLLSC